MLPGLDDENAFAIHVSWVERDIGLLECVGSVNSQRTPSTSEISTSESDPEVNLVCPWGDEVRTSERRQEVVEGIFIRHVQHAESHLHLRLIAVEQVVHAEAEVHDVARRDARRVGHVVHREGRQTPAEMALDRATASCMSDGVRAADAYRNQLAR